MTPSRHVDYGADTLSATRLTHSLFLAKHELHGRLTTNPNYIVYLTASKFLGCVAIVTHNPTLISSSHLGTWQFLK